MSLALRSTAAGAAVSPDRYRELARRVRLLSWLSLGAMSIEGAWRSWPGSSRARSR